MTDTDRSYDWLGLYVSATTPTPVPTPVPATPSTPATRPTRTRAPALTAEQIQRVRADINDNGPIARHRRRTARWLETLAEPDSDREPTE